MHVCVCWGVFFCFFLTTSNFELSHFWNHHSTYHVSIVFHLRLENWTMGLIVTVPCLSFNYLQKHNLLVNDGVDGI